MNLVQTGDTFSTDLAAVQVNAQQLLFSVNHNRLNAPGEAADRKYQLRAVSTQGCQFIGNGKYEILSLYLEASI